ncbi:MAG TPA: hypothetical protein EYH41_04490 [Novosphingobium capsulatum]|nr:hypothetical protein [Novosphingobium aromaticivorans]HIQ17245.1 hypothetical protein [Novosphingobium capsulatum]
MSVLGDWLKGFEMTTSDLIAAISAAFGGGGALGAAIGSVLARRRALRAAEPIIRIEWDQSGEVGAICFTNRIAEDLFVDRIDFDGEIWLGVGSYLPNGQPIKETRQFHAGPALPRHWRIDASSTTRFPFSIRPYVVGQSSRLSTPEMDGCEMRITISSSHATLRHRRITVIARRTV